MTSSPEVLDLGLLGLDPGHDVLRGRDRSGRFRVTLVAVRRAAGRLLANVHIGPLDHPAARTPR